MLFHLSINPKIPLLGHVFEETHSAHALTPIRDLMFRIRTRHTQPLQFTLLAYPQHGTISRLRLRYPMIADVERVQDVTHWGGPIGSLQSARTVA
jgi:hypothetical protein